MSHFKCLTEGKWILGSNLKTVNNKTILEWFGHKCNFSALYNVSILVEYHLMSKDFA